MRYSYNHRSLKTTFITFGIKFINKKLSILKEQCSHYIIQINLIVLFTPQNNMEDADNQNEGISDIFISLIDSLCAQIAGQPNRFLFEEVKLFLQSWPIQFNKIPFHFPDFIIQKIQPLQEYLSSQHNLIANFRNYLKQSLSKIKAAQKEISEPVQIFLDTKLCKKFSKAQVDQFFQKVETAIRDEQINVFLKERYTKCITQSDFEKEIKSKQIFGTDIPNLKTLISQIFQCRRKTLPLEKRLEKFKDKCEVFQTQLLEIKKLKENETKVSIIMQAKYEDEMYIFQTKKNRDDYVINLKLQKGKISSIVVQQYIEKPLKDVLAKIQRPKDDNNFVYNETWIINHNQYELSGSNIIPQGKYKVQIHFGQNWIVSIKDEAAKLQFILQFIRDQNKFVSVKYLIQDLNFTYGEFVNSYFIKIKEKSVQNQSSVKIQIKKSAFSKQRQTKEISQNIYKLKKVIISKFLSLNKQTFDKLMIQRIDRLTIDKTLLNSLGVSKILENIKKQSIKIGRQKEAFFQVILDQILDTVNYINLINKRGTLDSIKMASLFTMLKQSINTVKDKDLILFYGHTGAGKSTSIDYLVGIPLELSRNKYGDEIVKKCENSQRVFLQHEFSSIGHSDVLSQTIFPRGYNILDSQKLKVNYQNIVLCDNPGFQDTRGSFYEFFSQIGMDNSIEECRTIKSIVLVLPYNKILEDKGNRLLESLQIIEDKFPKVFKKQTKSFFILVTKPRDQTQDIQALKERFQNNLEELNNFICTQQQQGNITNLPQLESKAEKYQKLIEMCEEQQIKVLSINDEIERKKILNSFIMNPTQINKEEYMKTSGQEEWMSFLKEISVSTHTWVKLIFEPYSNELPKTIQSAQTALKKSIKNKLKFEKEIVILAQHIESKKNKIEQAQIEVSQIEYTIQQAYQNKNNLQGKNSVILVDETLQSNINKEFSHFQTSFLQLKQQISKLQSSIISEKQKREQLKQRLAFQSKGIQRIGMGLQEIHRVIQNHCCGYVEETILQKKYTLGEQIRLGREQFSQNKRNQYVKRGQVLPFEYETMFRCGQRQIETCKIYKISRSYSLTFSNDFDSKKILSKKLKQIGGCKGIIQSKNCTLQSVEMQASGKKLLLLVILDFKQTKNPQKLPYLKITIFIPKVQYYSDLLRNKEAEYRILHKQKQWIRKQYVQVCDSIVLCDSTIKKLKQQLQQKSCKYQKMSGQHEKWLKQLKNLRDKKVSDIDEAVKMKKNHLMSVRERIFCLKQSNQKNQEQINDKKTKIKEQDRKIVSIKMEYLKLEVRYRRFAYLIKTQMEKKIPQTLTELVKKAEEVTLSYIEKNDDQKKSGYYRQKIQIFRKFVELFEYPNKIYEGACKNVLKKSEVE